MRNLLQRLESVMGSREFGASRGRLSESASPYGWVESRLQRKGWKDADSGSGDAAYLYDAKQRVFFLFDDDKLVGAVKIMDGKGSYAGSNLFYFETKKAPVLYRLDAADKSKVVKVDLSGFKQTEKEIGDLPTAP